MSIGHTVAVKKQIWFVVTATTVLAVFSAGCSSDSASGSDVSASVGAPAVPKDCPKVSDGAQKEVEKRGAPKDVKAPEGDAPVDLVEGDGAAVAEGGSVKVHYVLAKIDGTPIESSWASGQPQEMALAQTPPEFAKAMAGMKVGGRRSFVVSASDLFGATPPSETGLTADDKVVFVVDLVSVSDTAEAAPSEPKSDKAALAAAEKRGAPKVTVPAEAPKDLAVIDDVVGKGAVVCPGATVLAHYTGVDISSGEKFDSSWDKGKPISFSLNGVIPGWTKGMVGMKVGGRRTLIIPGAMAYGESDKDSAGQPTGDLVFTIDLIGVTEPTS